jgi:hypothetical protein
MVGAQTVSGIVYDSESTVKGARLYNETQNKLNYTKGDGRFELEATLGDVLIIYSLFHQKLRVTVTPEFYEDVVVFELKQITNALDEVEVHKVIERKYDSTAFQNDLSIPARAPKTPVLRSGSNYEPTLNLISLASAIGRLFKRKKIDVPTIKAADFEKLFETDSFFTIDFLRKDLQIEEKEEYQFFEYCANQKLAPALLNNQLLMVEALLKCSANFRIAKESPNTN